MYLQTKLLLAISLALLAVFGALEYYSYQREKAQIEDQVLRQARSIRGVLMATRRVYHHQFLDSGLPLNDKTLGFLPAHALSRISKDFSNWVETDLSFNNVSDRPRNPENAADQIEEKAIRHFREHPDDKEWLTRYRKEGGNRFYQYARPIWTEQYCLKCHGDPKDAPETIRTQYDTAFDYKKGELRGVLSIKLPVEQLEKRLTATTRTGLLSTLSAFLGIFLITAWVLHRYVTARLARLGTASERIAEGDYSARVEVGGGDEVARTASAFNAMAQAVQQREASLDYQAHHDPLTDLPNRLLMQERLERAMAIARNDGCRVGLLFIDLDRFKNVNDTLGHDIGDGLLQETAKRLQANQREGDALARQGGDEFVLIMERVDDPREVASTAERLLAVMAEPVVSGGHELVTTPSIGIALFPDDATDRDTLMRYADTAMYQAKSGGGNTFHFFREEMGSPAQEQLLLENHLRHALEREELTVYYQPQWRLTDGAIVGVEALLRWEHPEWGRISPAEFIPVAETSGLIIPIGEWVLRQACAQLVAWHDQGHTDLKVAVNLSARQFRRPDLAEKVRTILQETGLPPEALELEITESTVMDDVAHAVSVMDTLYQQGVALALDDFGTGYSSLSQLKRFPLRTLKIDKSFVEAIPDDRYDRDIAQSVIALGHIMDLEVLAEGIETEAQQRFLWEHGCEQAQGFLFGRPGPAGTISELLGD